MKKVELFTVSSTVAVFNRCGDSYKDVVINWFVTNRPVPVADPLQWIDFAMASDPAHSIQAMNELFTRDEAEQLKEYLAMVQGDGCQIKPAGKIPGDIRPWGAIPVGGYDGFLKIQDGFDYGLLFNVSGYYDVEECERIPPKMVQSPPWRKSAGNVVPGEVKQPGMEKHRFDLLDFRLNGFEERLQEIDKRVDADREVIWKLLARLDALESKQPLNPA